MKQLTATKTYDVVWNENGHQGLRRAKVRIEGRHKMGDGPTCVHLRNVETGRLHLVRMIDFLEGDTNDFIHHVDNL
jgi:hypothetical protein